jgi:hypothetical protein
MSFVRFVSVIVVVKGALGDAPGGYARKDFQVVCLDSFPSSCGPHGRRGLRHAGVLYIGSRLVLFEAEAVVQQLLAPSDCQQRNVTMTAQLSRKQAHIASGSG